MKTDAKGTNTARERSDVAPIAEGLALKGREVICGKCAASVPVVALPGSNGVRVGWHRREDKTVKALHGGKVYVSCAGSWSKFEVTP